MKYVRKVFLNSRKSTLINNLFNFIKFVYPKYTNKFTFYFLRKNRTFIKSKYSRTRQWSKVIVFFGLWYGIISVFFMIAYCYRYMFIFSYLWWIIFIIIFFANFRLLKKNYKFFSMFNLF